MNKVKQHYDQLLAEHYEWMLGNIEEKQNQFTHFLQRNNVFPRVTRFAVDLGAGTGLQSIPLANMGYDVLAIDFCPFLLTELRNKANDNELPIQIIEDNLLEFCQYLHKVPELIVCAGDTLTHLETVDQVKALISKSYASLCLYGNLILSFREQTLLQTGDQFYLLVRQDSSRILTCHLSVFDHHMTVTDLLHMHTGDDWSLKTGSYNKLRLPVTDIIYLLEKQGFVLARFEKLDNFIYLIANKRK